jgi:hypothetical protein
MSVLTLGRYAHVEQSAVVEGVNRMPQFLAATGTDGPRLGRALTKPLMNAAPLVMTHEEEYARRESKHPLKSRRKCPFFEEAAQNQAHFLPIPSQSTAIYNVCSTRGRHCRRPFGPASLQ